MQSEDLQAEIPFRDMELVNILSNGKGTFKPLSLFLF